MTATSKRVESPLEYESDDTDVISLADTAYSDGYDATAEWELDRILAEGTEDVLQDDGTIKEEKRYLVKWSGYSVYRSTWQSEQDLRADAPETLKVWQEDKMRADRGFKELFDVNQWCYEKAERLAKRRRRHERRNQRRAKLGYPVVAYSEALYADPDASTESEYTDTDEEEDPIELVESSSDEKPVARKRQATIEDISDDDEPLVKPRKRRRTALQVERERQQTTDLLRRRKGTAIPVERNSSIRKSTSKAASKPNNIIPPVTKRKTNPATSQVIMPSHATSAPLLKKVEPQSSGRSWFGSLPKLQTNTVVKASLADAPVSGTPASSALDLPSAPVAKMVGGPSRMAKTPVTTTDTSRVGPTNFFAEKDKPVRVRKRAPIGQFNNLQHRHRALRAEQKDIAPSLEDVQLIDPATGKPVVRTPKGKITKAPKSIAPPAVQSTLDSPDGAAASWHEYTRVEQRSPVAEVTVQSTIIPARLRAMSPSVPGPTGDPLRTCAYHYKGWCQWQERCPFPHRESDGRPMSVAEMKKQLTCSYWYQGRCNKSDEMCEFSHSNKKFIASKSNEPPVRLITPRSETANAPVPSSHEGTTGARERWACWYWFFTDCRYSASECNYTHGQCQFIAPNPHTGGGPIFMATANALKVGVDIAHAADAESFPTPDWKPGSALHSEALIDTPPRAVLPSPPPRSPLTQLESQPGVPSFSFQPNMLRRVSEIAQPVDVVKDTAEMVNAKLCLYASDHEAEPDLLVDVRLSGLTGTSRVRFQAELFKLGSTLRVQHLCVAEMARAYLHCTKYRSLGAGQVLPVKNSLPKLEVLLEHLKLHSSGAVVFHVTFNMLLFPINVNTWKSLQPDIVPHKEAMLYFQMLSPFSAPAIVDTLAFQESEKSVQKAMFRSATSPDVERIFASSMKRSEKITMLVFGHQYASDMLPLMHYLQGIGMRVYHSIEAGTWERFCSQQKSGFVLFHPAFYAFDRIPGLAAKLDDGIDFFQMGFSNPVPSVNSSLATYTLTRIFPHGRAVFVSDACFSTSPRGTLEVIKALDTRIRRQGHGFTKILGRPGLLQWLYELAVTEHEQAHESVLIPLDNTRIELYTILAKLLADNPNHISAPPAPPRPTESSPLYFALESDLPGYGALWDHHARDAEKLMSGWFNAWTLAHLKEFRKFMVVCPEHLTGIWKANNKHLEVLTPYQYMRQVGEYHKKNAEQQKRAAQRKAEGK